MIKLGKGVMVTSFILCVAGSALAADHNDGPRASRDPAADIDDVYAWMSADAQRVYMAMTVTRNATTASRFSDSVQYVFHTMSRPNFGSPASAEVNVVCAFNAQQAIQCWAGGSEYVTGTGEQAGFPAGLVSASGKFKIFAGLRDDPFFFNLAGFRETARTVASVASTLNFDAAGCPTLDSATSNALVTQLQRGPSGAAPVDNFLGFNALTIVAVVDKSLLTSGGSLLSVWGSTNRIATAGGDCAGDLNRDGEVTIDEIIVSVNNALDGCTQPATPRLGSVQVDRMGRAGVNTALTNPFYRETVPAEEAMHEEIVDDYNSEANPAQWSRFIPEIAQNLAIIDSLDTVCGNQILAGTTVSPSRYNTLATFLADDQLFLNTNFGTCQTYLAVEAAAIGLPNEDCGGRTPLEDTIDRTYSVLAAGALEGVTDGIAADADATHSLTQFPFLDVPN